MQGYKMMEADKPLHKRLEEFNSKGMGDLLLFSILQYVFSLSEKAENIHKIWGHQLSTSTVSGGG